MTLIAADPRHGRPAGYVAGCREWCCTDAIARYEARRQLDILRGLPRTVPAVGAHRRIRALQRIGWPMETMSRRLGKGPQWLFRVTEETVIHRTTHDAIVRLYDDLSMTPGPSPSTRTRAKNKGWHSPLAWEDERIDDPNAEPDPPASERGQWRGEELLEEWDHLRRGGVHISEAAKRLGVTVAAIEKARTRHREVA